MITEEIVKKTAQQGMPALVDLFKRLPQEDGIKGLGILVILGVAGKAMNVIKDIVMSK